MRIIHHGEGRRCQAKKNRQLKYAYPIEIKYIKPRAKKEELTPAKIEKIKEEAGERKKVPGKKNRQLKYAYLIEIKYIKPRAKKEIFSCQAKF